jgi:hypothetical protein
MINEFKSYHGSAFTDLIDESSIPIKLFRPNLLNNSYYLLDDEIALYVKHSTKRLTPWRFTFHADHVRDLAEILQEREFIFLVLICGRDSIAVIDKDEITRILPLEKPSLSWVSVQTSHNTSLTVEGTSGVLKRKLRKSKPFWKVKELLVLRNSEE